MKLRIISVVAAAASSFSTKAICSGSFATSEKRRSNVVSTSEAKVIRNLQVRSHLPGKGNSSSKGKGSKSSKSCKSSKSSKSSKGSKSSKCSTASPSIAPTVSTIPSLIPSPSPSYEPSVSSKPSFVPSTNPSTSPSASPSSSPSFEPSVSSKPSRSPSASPSFIPSSTPSSEPSRSPSVSPSTIPSSLPSSEPSKSPSVSPTSFPSGTPSVSPSLEPSSSSAPSLVPSIPPTSAPTINTIVGFKKIAEGVLQQGCPVPATLNDSNFAEVAVQRISFSFVYTVRFRKLANAAAVISAIEKSFLDYIFHNYIECESLGQNLTNTSSNTRLVQEIDVNEAIGVSTLSMDERAMDIACADTFEDEECVPMNGSLELLFVDVAEISQSEEVNSVLAAIKVAIENGDIAFSNKDTRGLQYFGQRQGDFTAQGGIISSSIAGNPENNSGTRGGVSATGGAFIGTSFLVVALALFAGSKRRKRSRFERNNRGALTSLRSSKGDYDLQEVNPEEDEDTLETLSYTGSPDRGTKDSHFPLALPVSEAGESYADPKDMRFHTQDVHHCNSALCQHCAGSRETVQFIDSSEWYDTETDLSQPLRFHDEDNERTYDMSNTVTL